MKLLINPITPNEAYRFINETRLLHSYYHELTLSGATERILFFWECLAHSVLTNKEDWTGLTLSDFSFVADTAEQLQKELLIYSQKEKFNTCAECACAKFADETIKSRRIND